MQSFERPPARYPALISLPDYSFVGGFARKEPGAAWDLGHSDTDPGITPEQARLADGLHYAERKVSRNWLS